MWVLKEDPRARVVASVADARAGREETGDAGERRDASSFEA
jgi:hypothetical protein